MDEAIEAARTAHPSVQFDAQALRLFLRARQQPSSPEIAVDLCLAWACLNGDVAALARLERDYLSLVPQFIARIQQDADAVEEVKQVMRDRLLLARGERRPTLAEYTGRGRLASWLRVVAARTALNQRAAEKPSVDAEEVEPLLVAGKDTELEYLRSRYQGEFRSAFEHALATIEPRERTMLRFQLVDGLSIDRIAEIYDVHRATAARWINQARDSLFRLTHDKLCDELGLSDSEVASIARLL